MKRGFSKGGKVATGEFVRRMYNVQKYQLFRPIRRLTKRHIDPNNFEKQNVIRTVDIFSADTIAAPNMFAGLGDADFVGSGETRHFMSQFLKW